MDANVQKIVDAGFSEEQAESVLRYTKHNVERALKILTKRDISEGRSRDKTQKDSEPPPHKGRRGRTREKDLNDDEIPVKPTAKVSLFDFLEDKLPNMPERDKRQNNNNTEERNEKNNHGRDKHSAKNSRHNGSRYDKHRDNRSHYNDNHQSSHRDDRKYQQQTEKPPRFQRKIEERNKQALLQQQQRQQMQQQQQQLSSSNINVNINPYNTYQASYHDMMSDMSMNESIHHQTHLPSYRNSMDGLTEAAASLMLSSPPRETMQEVQRYNSPPNPYASLQPLQEIQSYGLVSCLNRVCWNLCHKALVA